MKSIDKKVMVGTPLMAEETDAQALAQVLNNESDVKTAVQNGIVAFMGHGNPEGYDYYGGNIRYLQLEDALRALNTNYYVGTVDMDETYAADVLNHIGGGSFTYHVGDKTLLVTTLITIWLILTMTRAGTVCSTMQVSRRRPMSSTSPHPVGRTIRQRYRLTVISQDWQSVMLSVCSG